MTRVTSILRAEVVRPAGLSEAECAAWTRMQAAHPAFGDPLFGVPFARAVGAVLDDAYVAVYRRGERIVGFLAHHRRPSGFARPIGAPFCDYHGLISEPGEVLDGGQALAAAGLRALRCTGLVDPHGVFGAEVGDPAPTYAITLDTGADAYLEALRVASPKRFKNYRRLEHKLEREVGKIELVVDDVSDDDFQRLIDWKRDQARRTGAHDFLGPTWTRRLMRNLFATRGEAFGGLMIMLRAGGQPVAAHFGPRQGDWYHPWIAASDPAFDAWSPGHIFLTRAIAAMPDLDLRTYDLGVGHDHYKRPFCLTTGEIRVGLARSRSLAGQTAGVVNRVLDFAAPAGGLALARLRRRLDQIAAVEHSAGGRVRGILDAVAGGARRAASRPSGPGVLASPRG